MVYPGIRRGLRPGVGLWISPGGLALRISGGCLVHRCAAAMAAYGAKPKIVGKILVPVQPLPLGNLNRIHFPLGELPIIYITAEIVGKE